MKSRRRKLSRYTGKKKNERNRSILTVILILVFISLVVFLSIRLGLYLREKAKFSEEKRESDTIPPEVTRESSTGEDYSLNVAVKLNGKYISLKEIGQNSEKYAEEVALVGEGDLVSLVFRDIVGNLFFFSKTAQALGDQKTENGLPGIEEIIRPLKDKGCTVCAVFGLNADFGDTAEAEAMRAYENAVLAELCTAGIDEVMVYTPSLDGEDEILACAKNAEAFISKYADKTKIGLLMPYSIFSNGNGNTACHTLAPVFDFLAVDYTDAPEEENSAAEISSRADAMQIFFSRYSLRAVLDPEKTNSTYEKDALAKSAIYRIQDLSAKDLFSTGSEDIK